MELTVSGLKCFFIIINGRLGDGDKMTVLASRTMAMSDWRSKHKQWMKERIRSAHGPHCRSPICSPAHVRPKQGRSPWDLLNVLGISVGSIPKYCKFWFSMFFNWFWSLILGLIRIDSMNLGSTKRLSTIWISKEFWCMSVNEGYSWACQLVSPYSALKEG